MRVPVLVYALLYLVVELIGSRLAAVEWARVTPLMVASAVTDALLVVAVLVAALVAADLSKHRWRPALDEWLSDARRFGSGPWGSSADDPCAEAEVVGVTSWRAEPLALPMGSPAAPPTATYATPTYAVSGTPSAPGRPFPEDDGRLL